MKDYLYQTHDVTPKQFARQILYQALESAGYWIEHWKDEDERNRPRFTDKQVAEVDRHLVKMTEAIRKRYDLRHNTWEKR